MQQCLKGKFTFLLTFRLLDSLLKPFPKFLLQVCTRPLLAVPRTFVLEQFPNTKDKREIVLKLTYNL